MARKLRFTRWGLAENPTGQYVAMQLRDSLLLGEVTGFERNEVRGMIMLTVKHFNGEPWPFQPAALAVDVLDNPYAIPSSKVE